MDYTKTCWYCGKNMMAKQDGFYACENCGATWTEQPKLDIKIVCIEPNLVAGGTKHTPSKAYVKRIEKIRRRSGDATNI